MNRRQTIVKVLAFDGDGYWIWSKRLEAGRYATRGETRAEKGLLNRMTLLALIEGTEIEVKRQRKRYRKAA